MKSLLSFIHIGLPKCASTYLQNVWARDPNYFSVNVNEMMSTARRLALNPAADIPGYSINIDSQKIPPQKVGARIIASSEGFSWAFCNNPGKQKNLDRLHMVSSQMLGKSRICDSILLMVRNPIDYMRSLHEQSIKEGGHESFGEFFCRQRALIESTINLSLIKKAYDQYFENVVILSADELRHQSEAFWGKYCSRLSAPEPLQTTLIEASRGVSANKSLGREKLYCLALLNRHSTLLQDIFGGLEDYKAIFPAEFKNIRKTYPNLSMWMNRRIAEFSTVDALHQLTVCFREEKSIQDQFQQILIDQEMSDFVETNFLKPLERLDTIEKDTIAGYRVSLEGTVR